MKYAIEFKLRVVEDYLQGHVGYKAISARHAIRWETVRKWVRAYRAHGKAGLQGKYERYSEQVIQTVVQRMSSEGLSCQQAAALFNIRSASAIGNWKRRIDKEGKVSVPETSIKPRKASGAEGGRVDASSAALPSDKDALIKEVYRLRMEVAYLKKVAALVHASARLAPGKKR